NGDPCARWARRFFRSVLLVIGTFHVSDQPVADPGESMRPVGATTLATVAAWPVIAAAVPCGICGLQGRGRPGEGAVLHQPPGTPDTTQWQTEVCWPLAPAGPGKLRQALMRNVIAKCHLGSPVRARPQAGAISAYRGPAGQRAVGGGDG